jgi:hypothetical protein
MTEHRARDAASHDTRANGGGLGSLVGNIVTDLSDLVRQETELAKIELKQEAAKAGKAAGYFGGAGGSAHLAAVFLSLAVALGLAEWWDTDLGWTALLVGLLWAILAAALFVAARNRARSVDPVPRQTIETLRETV